MSFDCRLHIAVTPYSTHCVPDGIKAVERFDPIKLGRRPWPRVCQGRGRCPEGGVGGQIVAEQILVIWDGNRLIYPISENPKPLAERPVHYDTEIHYYGSFLAQLDGQVAYEPNPANLEHYIILVESPVAVMHAVRFAPSQTAIIDPFIKHSMPIPLDGQLNFNAWHRSVNVVIQQSADSAGHQRLVVNLCKVNRIEPITLRQVGLPPEEALPAKKVPKLPHLSNSFAHDLKQLSDVNAHAFSAYGRLIPDFTMHNEQPTEVPWPGTESVPGDGMAGTLCQEFIVSWKPGGETGQFLELEFEGISGTFAGEKGRPGVEYSPELGSYRANLLMARPDGSFYLQPSDYNDTFALAVALPESETGEPVDHTLQAFIFRNGQACRLEPGVWHSVPIPIAGSDPVVFTEVVAATNANLVVNVQSETGHPVQFVQSV